MNMHRYASTGQRCTALLLALALLVSGLSTAPAAAQDLSFPDSATTDELLADQLVAIAWMTFAREAEPRPDQLERARILLDMAAELSPDDEGMWQLRSSLAKSLGDSDLLIDSLNNYIRLQPKDDVAQLEKFQAELGRIESVDDYLEMLERLLRAEKTSTFSSPLRSRLASMAAQAAQEIGDNDRMALWLGYALKLDPVNPDAARMMYQLTVDREGTARQQGTALVNLLKANPADASFRAALANTLMQEAVYEQALDQFNVAMNLVDMQARLQLLTQYTLCLIASGRESEVPPLLLELQLFLQQMEDAQNPDLVVEEDEEPEAPSLDDLPLLPTTLEFARLILMSTNNPVAAEESFNRLQEATAMITEPEVKQDSLKQMVWVAAVFEQDPAWVQQRIDALDADDPIAQLATGWLALRRGDTTIAKQLFESLGPEDMFARLGLASLPDLDDDQRALAYQQIVWDDPVSMAAIVAARRLHRMGKPITPTSQGVPLRVLVDDLSRQLWTPAFTVSPWIRMQMTVSPGSFGYLQPMNANIRLTNATRVPLSVGADSAVQPVLMVMNSPTVRNEPMGPMQPTFFNMGRRLTLQPGETIRADIRLDRFDIGQLTAQYPSTAISFSASAILDPRPLPNGAITAGPLGAADNVGSLIARSMPATPGNLQLWIKDLDDTDPAVRALALARLLVLARQPAEEVEALDFRDKVQDKVSQRFPSFDSKTKAWTIRFMLPDEDGNPVAQRVIDLAQRSDDPMVRIMYLAMNADSPDAPALTDAIRHDDPTIRTFAQAMKAGFEKEAERAAELENPTEPEAEDDIFDLLGPGEIQPETQDPWLP